MTSNHLSKKKKEKYKIVLFDLSCLASWSLFKTTEDHPRREIAKICNSDSRSVIQLETSSGERCRKNVWDMPVATFNNMKQQYYENALHVAQEQGDDDGEERMHERLADACKMSLLEKIMKYIALELGGKRKSGARKYLCLC